jgi:secreted PhoX family phosphatase
MVGANARGEDFGLTVEELLNAQSNELYGIEKPLGMPADAGDVVPREDATANERQLLAQGLKAQFVTRSVASLGDMIAFWPYDINYTHLIVCIEQERSGTTPEGNEGLNAAIQRVNVETGDVETILHGMSRCDGIRTTQWGTVLATEEVEDGRAYEIIDPLNTTGHWIADRATGDIRDGVDSPNESTKVVQRQTLPTLRWEGLTILDTGIVYLGDELRPGDTALDVDGGAIYKFTPDAPYDCGASQAVPDGQLCPNTIDDLADSPLLAGHSYAYTASCQPRTEDSFPQYGQGCEIGEGAWVEVNELTAPTDANARGATGYYRPEDLHADPTFGIFSHDPEAGVRFCWTNTGNEEAQNFSETVCMVDEDPNASSTITDDRTRLVYLSRDGTEFAVAVANRFIEGDQRFNSFDNLAFQAHTGNLYVIEDHEFGEIFACLPDGKDRDNKTDGCASILSIADPDAEPTGFIFDGTGRNAFYIMQHSQQTTSLLDFRSNPVDGSTDDLIKITGFQEGARESK